MLWAIYFWSGGRVALIDGLDVVARHDSPRSQSIYWFSCLSSKTCSYTWHSGKVSFPYSVQNNK